jgi:hypothetical protein
MTSDMTLDMTLDMPQTSDSNMFFFKLGMTSNSVITSDGKWEKSLKI